MNDAFKRHKRFPRFIFFGIIAVAFFSLIVMLLWNWLVPSFIPRTGNKLLAGCRFAGTVKDNLFQPGQRLAKFP